MTTVPGHNQILPQSTIVQELGQQAHASKPSPDQAAVIQQNQQNQQNSSVQGSEESERLKQQREKKRARRKEANQKKKRLKEEAALDPEATGRLLDTTV